MTPKEAKDKAREVNAISLDYHLSHALCASNALIKKKSKDNLLKKTQALKERLTAAKKADDDAAIVQISEEIGRLSRQVLICVEYVENMVEDGGRVVWINGQLIISLPRKLVDAARKRDDTLDPAGVRHLREIMAHELGHIVLHIDELLETDSHLQGDKLLTPEAEAWAFARELLDLRHQRNDEYFKSGAYKNF
jgi:hypothetical protein